MSENIDPGISSRAEELLQVFKKGAEFTQGLLKENERLRYRLLELEQQLRAQDTGRQLEQLREQLNRAEAEKREILERISSIERENLDYANRYVEIEAENNLLANLYITTYQLHSTADPWELVRVIEEILLNLVGAEQFSLLLREADGQLVRPVVDDSGDLRVASVEVSDRRVLDALESGAVWIAAGEMLSELGASEVKAVAPLKVDGEVIGALAIYRLLNQKDGFSRTDEEILAILGEHAATAICTAVLRQKSRGRMSFRQGFERQD